MPRDNSQLLCMLKKFFLDTHIEWCAVALWLNAFGIDNQLLFLTNLFSVVWFKVCLFDISKLEKFIILCIWKEEKTRTKYLKFLFNIFAGIWFNFYQWTLLECHRFLLVLLGRRRNSPSSHYYNEVAALRSCLMENVLNAVKVELILL